MYSCQRFIGSPPPDSRSGGSSRFVIPNLCFHSQENSVEDIKGEQKIAWFHPGMDWSTKVITF